MRKQGRVGVRLQSGEKYAQVIIFMANPYHQLILT